MNVKWGDVKADYARKDAEIEALKAMNAELVANLEYFVHRVDAGTARSTTTYNKFKATLAKAKELSHE